MAFLTTRADTILTAVAADAEMQLHTGDPGAAGTANVALQADDTTPVVRKAVTFGAISNADGGGRQVASDVAVSWSDVEIPAGREISHFTIWTASGDGDYGDALAATKTTGSDGVTFDAGNVTLKAV